MELIVKFVNTFHVPNVITSLACMVDARFNTSTVASTFFSIGNQSKGYVGLINFC